MCRSAARSVATCFAGSTQPMINVAVCETNVSLSQKFSNYFDKYVLSKLFSKALYITIPTFKSYVAPKVINGGTNRIGIESLY